MLSRRFWSKIVGSTSPFLSRSNIRSVWGLFCVSSENTNRIHEPNHAQKSLRKPRGLEWWTTTNKKLRITTMEDVYAWKYCAIYSSSMYTMSIAEWGLSWCTKSEDWKFFESQRCLAIKNWSSWQDKLHRPLTVHYDLKGEITTLDGNLQNAFDTQKVSPTFEAIKLIC